MSKNNSSNVLPSSNLGGTKNTSHIMKMIQIAVKKNVEEARRFKYPPYIDGSIPLNFSKDMELHPTVVFIVSCRVPSNDSVAHSPASFLRQRSSEVARKKNILWDTNGPWSKIGERHNEHHPSFATFKRLMDPKQMLTLEAHGETASNREYTINKSNIFFIYIADTGTSLNGGQGNTQLARANTALFELLRGDLGRREWLNFLMGSRGMENPIRKWLRNKVYGNHSREGDLSWRVYRPGDHMPTYKYEFHTAYNNGMYFRSGIYNFDHNLKTNLALRGRVGQEQLSRSTLQIWEDAKNYGLSLPYVPELTFNARNQVTKVDMLVGRENKVWNFNQGGRQDSSRLKKVLNNNSKGRRLNGNSDMKFFYGLCLPNLLDYVPCKVLETQDTTLVYWTMTKCLEFELRRTNAPSEVWDQLRSLKFENNGGKEGNKRLKLFSCWGLHNRSRWTQHLLGKQHPRFPQHIIQLLNNSSITPVTAPVAAPAAESDVDMVDVNNKVDYNSDDSDSDVDMVDVNDTGGESKKTPKKYEIPISSAVPATDISHPTTPDIDTILMNTLLKKMRLPKFLALNIIKIIHQEDLYKFIPRVSNIESFLNYINQKYFSYIPPDPIPMVFNQWFNKNEFNLQNIWNREQGSWEDDISFDRFVWDEWLIENGKLERFEGPRYGGNYKKINYIKLKNKRKNKRKNKKTKKKLFKKIFLKRNKNKTKQRKSLKYYKKYKLKKKSRKRKRKSRRRKR